jgi:tetratricopeptide (TPR) repeat protein
VGRTQLLCAQYLLAGFCLIALISSAKAEVAAKSAQARTGCAARDINVVIPGCSVIVGDHSASKTRLIQAYLNRGKALAKRGSFAQAIADFDQVIRLSPGNAEAYRERGQSRWGRNEIADAEADLKAAIRLNPNDAKTYVARGWFYKSNGSNEQAKPN